MSLMPRIAYVVGPLVLVTALAAASEAPVGTSGAAPSDAPAPAAMTSAGTPEAIPAATPEAGSAAAAGTAAPLNFELGKELFGRSGAMRTVMARPGETVALPIVWQGPRPERLEFRWAPAFDATRPATGGVVPAGDRVVAPAEPGVYELELGNGAEARRLGDRLRLVVTVPFEQKRNGYIGRYFMGSWPTEGSGRTDRYAPPGGFIRVTRENQHLKLSEHFSLKEFLTHDQGNVWPKYVVVDPRLLDKLELVMADLNANGVQADHMIVMSGFRTPQYNRKGLNQGRASLSRHQYGDAADVWVDNDGDWYMDDLNGDGRRDTRDSRVMLAAVERVEARHPELLGGAGVYRDNGAHGPFLHIDVRGSKARW